MSLSLYNKKRDFKQTREPKGKKEAVASFRFVVQRHEATRLHYDFRLELDGVLKSWAVPRGPSMNTTDKRLAVMVEDHPVSYIDFKGMIPEGNYGAGRVAIWDKGRYFPVNEKNEKITEKEALQWMKKGELKFIVSGRKIKGGFVLIKLRFDEKSWLLIKHKDEYAVKKAYDSETLVPKSLRTPLKKASKKTATKRVPVKKKSPPAKSAVRKRKGTKSTSS
jgi:bifunctional non-homologous end joining protein LigD